MLGLKDKVAVVTGSSDAIGRVIALRLASEGVKVIVNGRDAAKGAAVVGEIAQLGGEAFFVKADVMEYEQMTGLVRSGIDRFGQVDIMIASAGGGGGVAAAPRQSTGPYFNQQYIPELAQSTAHYLAARLNPIRAALDHMIERQSGSLIMLTSEGGRFPTAGQVSMALGSGGIVMATKTIAKEITRWHIRLNTISISLIDDTPIKRSYDAQVASGAERQGTYFDKVIARAPFGLANPKDIAETAAFLASDSSRMFTGATLSPTGGLTFPS